MAFSLYFLNLLCCALSYNLDVKYPIVYTLPKKATRLQYFGYSVAVRPRAEEYLNWSWVIQIGCPRSNISGLPGNPVEPGAVYRCRVDGECELARLDTTGNVHIGVNRRGGIRHLASERKDNGWVGVSMDIQVTPLGEVTVVCGHRITFQATTRPLGIDDGAYLTIGGCYLQLLYRSYNTTTLLLPLKNENKTYHQISKDTADFDWGQGLAGMSVHFTPNKLIIGAPHVYYMTGTVLSYSRNGTDLNVADVMRAPFVGGDYFAYNGYSIGSGKFFGGAMEWHVFGSPRSGNLHGRVFAFQFIQRGGHTSIHVHPSVLRGETYGEYFGASLAVGDINGDGYDDLIIGAPMYAQRLIDQGRVYVYLGNKLVSLGFEPPQQGAVLTGAAENGRFGTSVTVAGDIDQDGFQDIVIGAPYEEIGGVVYIYRGSAKGPTPHYSQVIRAKELNPQLRGFGVSISLAVDVDRNGYPDLVIGAYQSDQAVLLRSHPVIKLQPQIQTIIIDRKQIDFNITVCFPYFAKTPPSSLVFDFSATLDQKLKRAHFSNGSRTYSMKNVTTHFTTPLCVNIPVAIDSATVNGTYGIPIEVNVLATLIKNEAEGETQTVWEKKVKVPSLLPIADTATTSRTTADFPFAEDCGLDKICHSYLTSNCHFNHSTTRSILFAVGSEKKIGFKVTVQNKGEPSHLTALQFHADGIPVTDIIPFDYPCLVSQAGLLVCDLETVDEGTEKSMSFQLAADMWATYASENVNLFINAKTSSNNTNPTDGSCRLSLDLFSDADLLLDASASVPKISLSKISNRYLNFSHYYEVYKTGMSPVSSIHFQVSMPISINGQRFAEYSKELSSISVESEVSRLDLEGQPEITVGTRSGFYEEETVLSEGLDGKRFLFLNCSVANVKCLTVSFASSQKNLAYEIPLLFDMSSLGRLLDDVDVIVYETNATALAEHVFEQGVSIRKNVARTIIVINLPVAASIGIKTLVFSIAAGVLLLIIILLILARKGFFRRKKKEEMLAIKTQDFIAQRFSMYGTSNQEPESPGFSVDTVCLPDEATY